jgi:hypothetical protein
MLALGFLIFCAICVALLAFAAKMQNRQVMEHRSTPSVARAMSVSPLVGPNPLSEANLSALQQAKAEIAHYRQIGIADADVDFFEKEIDTAIAQIVWTQNERIEALKRETLEQQDDICPECNQPFACNNDYICDECRAKVG